jgi:hypothetical protein
MAKFKGYGLVWNKDKDEVLCEFKNGEAETSDKKVISKLKELKYEEIDTTGDTEVQATENPAPAETK